MQIEEYFDFLSSDDIRIKGHRIGIEIEDAGKSMDLSKRLTLILLRGMKNVLPADQGKNC